MTEEQLNELSLNKNYGDIEETYNLLREMVRHNLSAKLMDTDEEHPKDVYISLEYGACGLSSLEMPAIVSLYQEPCEGIIYVKYDDADDYVELDDLFLEDMMQIVKDLEDGQM